jgi:hypothetical protein
MLLAAGLNDPGFIDRIRAKETDPKSLEAPAKPTEPTVTNKKKKTTAKTSFKQWSRKRLEDSK